MGTTDTGWAWVVLGGSMLGLFLSGVQRYFVGVMHAELLLKYHASNTTTAWVGALYMSLMDLGGPLASVVIGRFGCRVCCIMGGVLCFIGFAASAFTTSITQLFFTYGLVAGLGFGLTYSPSVLCVGYYFNKLLPMASGLASGAAAVGMLFGPLLVQSLINEFRVSGGFLLLAALSLHHCVSGMLFRPTSFGPLDTSLEIPQGSLLSDDEEEKEDDGDDGDDENDSGLAEESSYCAGFTHHGEFINITTTTTTEDDGGGRLKDGSVSVSSEKLTTTTAPEKAGGGSESLSERVLVTGNTGFSRSERGSAKDGATSSEEGVGFLEESSDSTERNGSSRGDVRFPIATAASTNHATNVLLPSNNENAGTNHVRSHCDRESDAERFATKNNEKSETGDFETQGCARVNRHETATKTGQSSLQHQKKKRSPVLKQKKHKGSETGAAAVVVVVDICDNDSEDLTTPFISQEDLQTSAKEPKKKKNVVRKPFNDDAFQDISESVSSSSTTITTTTATSTEEKEGESSCKGSVRRLLDNYRVVLCNKAFMLHCSSLLLSGMHQSGAFFHLPEYVQTLGVSPNMAAQLFVAAGVGSLVSRVSSGVLTTDSAIDPLIVSIGMTGLTAVATLLLPLYSATYLGQTVFSLLAGLYTGGLAALLNVLTKRFVGVTHMHTAFGVSIFLTGVGGILGPLLAALIVDYGWQYEHSFIILGILMLIAAFLDLIAGVYYLRHSPTDDAIEASPI